MDYEQWFGDAEGENDDGFVDGSPSSCDETTAMPTMMMMMLMATLVTLTEGRLGVGEVMTVT